MTGLDLVAARDELRDAVGRYDQAAVQGTGLGTAVEAMHLAATDLLAVLAMALTDEDTCRTGDVDPTNGIDGRDHCGTEDQGLVCTRRSWHPCRQHVAGNGNGRRVVHTWPWTPAELAGGEAR